MCKNFLFIGGDKRQLYAADIILKCGHKTSFYGFGEKDCFSYCETYDYFVLPAPFSKDGTTIFAPFSENEISISELNKFNTPKIIIGGNCNLLKESQSTEIFDLLKCDEYNILNATATAEGAISLAIANTPCNLRGSNVLICGFGKIGKILAQDLAGMGANVYVSARKGTDRAYAKTFGYTSLDYNELKFYADKFDIIFNTVPALIIKEEIITKLKKTCLTIDLASKPGGFDFDVLEKLGIKNIWALGLPGKYSPETSGEIIAEIILKITGGKV